MNDSPFDGAQSMSSSPQFAEPPTIGRYECIHELGRGASGVVWLAFDQQLKRTVALKLLHKSAAQRSEARARFKAEARAGARLQHANIVAVLDADEFEGQLFIAQELVEGAGTLHQWIESTRASGMSVAARFRAAANMAAVLGDALDVAHRSGIVHRDVNPANVLVDGGERPLLVDFGIAHLADAESTTVTGEIRGTPAYMAPEQVDRALGSIDARTDVYGLGATLFHMLTLERPVAGETALHVMRNVLDHGVPDPRKVLPQIPVDLAAICIKATSRAASKRYASTQALADDLRRWLGHETVVARTPGVASRGWRWCRRHPIWATASAAALSFLVAASWMVVELRAREQQARDQAQQTNDALTIAFESMALLQPSASSDPREHAQRAVERLESALSADRGVRGPARARLAQNAALLAERWGLLPHAERLLRAALSEYERTEGPRSPAALAVRASLGGVLSGLGRRSEAHVELAAVLGLLVVSPDATPLTICAARTNLAGERLVSGDVTSAKLLLEQALDEHLMALGRASDPILKVHYLYCAALASSRDHWAAARELESFLARADEGGKGDSDMAHVAHSTLGAVYNAIGEYECAERELSLAHARLERQLGRRHPNTLITAVNLADACMGLGRREEALALFSEVLAAREATLAPSDPARLSMHSSVGLALVDLFRYDQAEPHLREVVEQPGEVLLTGTDVKSNARCNLARLLVETGRFDEALTLAQLEYERRTKLLARQDRDRLIALEVLVRALLGRREFALALERARELVADTPSGAREYERRRKLLARVEEGPSGPIEANAPRER